MPVLENDFLKVEVSADGAEMISLFNKNSEVEHLWQGDPTFWAFHSPVLFPIVGRSLNDQIQVNGENYPLRRHGFARNSLFSIVEESPEHAKFSLSYSDETLAIYPFKFTFQVLYDLFDSELRISYKVINQDDKTILFSVGAHPAFNIPFYEGHNYEDYFLEFEEDELLKKDLLNEQGFFTGEAEDVALANGLLPLSQDLFKNGAIVFKELASRKIIIKNHKVPDFISISFPHFNSLGIWASAGAPFVCIEPWIGFADDEGPAVDFSLKPGVKVLEQGHVFEVDYTIGIN